MQTGGIILCGGKSSRMGSSKALLPFGNETLLQRIVRIMSEVLSPIVVVAAKGQALPALPREVILQTDREEGKGPLEGLAAGLEAIQNQCDAIFLSSCDVPFLKKDFVLGMIANLGASKMCIPKTAGFYHPLAAVYRVEILKEVTELLKKGQLRPFFLLEKVQGKVIEEPTLIQFDPSLSSLRNLNNQEDFKKAIEDFWEESFEK